MTAPWAGPEPEPLAPPSLRQRLRFAARAALAVAATLALAGVWLAARGLDLLARRLRPGLPALAPRVTHAWGRLALALTGIEHRQVGRPMDRPGAIVANHASWLDILVLMASGRVFFVSKSEVGKWPGIGPLARMVGTVFIERRPAEARRQRDLLFARLVRGDRMVIFPEGTSTDGRRVLRFKSTLFEVFFAPELRGRVWVQPVTIVYRAPPGLPPSFLGWWGEMDFLTSARDVVGRGRGGRVTVVFHEPLRVADFPGRKAMAEQAETAVRAALDRVVAAGEGPVAPAGATGR